MKHLFTLVVCCVFGASATAQSTEPKLTGVFSDLRYSKHSGDVIGMEVFVVFAGEKGLFATIQCSEGWPSKPVLVPAIAKGSSIELAAHNDSASHCPKVPFRGVVSQSGLRGQFEGMADKVFLKRKQSFWQ